MSSFINIPPNSRCHSALPDADPDVELKLVGLWRKYADELADISVEMSVLSKGMRNSNHAAVFGDIEGELLYICIRETKPEIVFEISPNSGYSTNYMLSAVTRNGVGRVESFELIEEFDGVPTKDVIRRNMIKSCDPSRHNLNIGDARIETIRRLEHGAPTFTLLDSCHDDFFGEFYVKVLLPKLNGIVVIQDILHFDPRPEWSTEGLYILSWLYETGVPYLPLSFYEDVLNKSAVRKNLKPRRAFRGNSILLSTDNLPVQEDKTAAWLGLMLAEQQKQPVVLNPLFPLNSTLTARQLRSGFLARDLPEDRYVAAFFGRNLDENRPRFCDIMALFKAAYIPLTGSMAAALIVSFGSFDICLQTVIVDLLARHGYNADSAALLYRLNIHQLSGVELPTYLAHAAVSLGLKDMGRSLIRISRRNGADRSLSVGFRALLQCVSLADTLGAPSLLNGLIDDILSIRGFRIETAGQVAANKLDQELTFLCQNFPHIGDVVDTHLKMRSTEAD